MHLSPPFVGDSCGFFPVRRGGGLRFVLGCLSCWVLYGLGWIGLGICPRIERI
jgi:hypothetical protein